MVKHCFIQVPYRATCGHRKRQVRLGAVACLHNTPKDNSKCMANVVVPNRHVVPFKTSFGQIFMNAASGDSKEHGNRSKPNLPTKKSCKYFQPPSCEGFFAGQGTTHIC
jgi:hypothetical protein